MHAMNVRKSQADLSGFVYHFRCTLFIEIEVFKVFEVIKPIGHDLDRGSSRERCQFNIPFKCFDP